MPPLSSCPPYVIASGAKQSSLAHDPRLLRSARNDTGSARNDTGSARNDTGSARNDTGSARNETGRVFRAAAMVAQNVATEKLEKQEVQMSC